MFDNFKFPQNFAIRIKAFRNILNIIHIFLVPQIHTKENIVNRYPPMILIPSNGIAIKLDNKNVKDIVPKFFTIIGNIVICAAIGTLIFFISPCNPPNLVGV